MIVEKFTLKVETGFSEDNKHRFYLKKVWDSKKKSALVIMLSSGMCNGVTMDYSSLFTINNLVKLGYGSVEILNLFTSVGDNINANSLKEVDIVLENNKLIMNKAKSSDSIIIAWGRAGSTNKVVKKREDEVMSLLKTFKEKVFVLCDESGNKKFHPLSPKCRNSWNLVSINEFKS